MAYMKNIKPKKAALCLALCLAVIILTDLLLPMGEAAVYNSVVRLHVLANSDTDLDQAVKLAVRDEILNAKIFKNATNITEATEDIDRASSEAVAVANAYLKANGLPYTASCEWGTESYPTRIYESIKLPAGEYLSLRIVLGEGEGQNWWCVLFPPMCNGAASKKITNGKENAVFGSENKRYTIRFKILEWFYK